MMEITPNIELLTFILGGFVFIGTIVYGYSSDKAKEAQKGVARDDIIQEIKNDQVLILQKIDDFTKTSNDTAKSVAVIQNDIITLYKQNDRNRTNGTK